MINAISPMLFAVRLRLLLEEMYDGPGSMLVPGTAPGNVVKETEGKRHRLR